MKLACLPIRIRAASQQTSKRFWSALPLAGEEDKLAVAEVVGVSVDSQFTHLAWIKTPRKDGGLGPLDIPLLSDLTHKISKDYGVYLEDAGHTLRGLFIIDGKGILR